MWVDGRLTEEKAEAEQSSVKIAVGACKIKSILVSVPMGDRANGAAIAARGPVAAACTVRVPERVN